MAVFVQLNLDPRCMSGHSLIHRVIDDFRDHMVQRPVVFPADIHTGA